MLFYKYLIILIKFSFFIETIQIDKHDNGNCSTYECKFIYNKFIKNLSQGNPCKNFHSYTCKTSNENIFENNYNNSKDLITLEENMSAILRSKIEKYELKSLSVEKELYQHCLKLDLKNDKPEDFKIVSSLFKMVKNVVQNDSWQIIERYLYKMNFDYTFFDINVVQDPENLNEYIILIEPPPISLINYINDTLTFIFQNNLDELYDYEEIKDVKSFYGFAKIKYKQSLEDFMDAWIDALDFTSTNKYIQFPNKKTSIKEWTQEYNNRKDNTEKTPFIDWYKILINVFREVHVKVNYYQPIIVKNFPYFTRLFYLLSDTANDVTAIMTLLKAVTANLRYIDWDLAQLSRPENISSFCFYETQLYGASYEFLPHLKHENRISIIHYEEILKITRYIVQAMHSEIYSSLSLSYKKESYLLSELDKILTNLYFDIWNFDTISNYYGQIIITSNYFDSIIKYRKMIKNKQYSRLKNDLKLLKHEPFSVTNLKSPANRFMLNIYFLINAFPQSILPRSLPKEFYYGVFGTKIASTLYALLNENKFEDMSRHKKKLNAHPEYSHDAIICLFPESGKYAEMYGSNAVSQLHGLRIAYKAMELGDKNKAQFNMNNITFPRYNITNIDQIFFLAYSKSRCHEYDRIINTVISNNKNFIIEFDCNQTYYYDDFKCDLKAFDSVNDRVYLINL